MFITIGLYDAPQKQDQPPVVLDLFKSNIAVFGGPMSGKTTFIKTLLVRLNEHTDTIPEESTYIIDFGGNIGDYSKLGSVCACFDNSNEENVKRVFSVIEKRLKENAGALQGDSYYEVYRKNPEKCPPHMTLIIENLNAFLSDDRYSSYYDWLMAFCRDGLSKGLTIITTANDVTGTNRMMANFGQKIAFEMPTDNYFDIFNARVTRPMKTPGRGLINLESDVYEFQCYLPHPLDENTKQPVDEDLFLQRLIEISTHNNPYKLDKFPDILTIENIYESCSDEKELRLQSDKDIVVGLDYYMHNPITIDINKDRVIAIYGKRQFGKANLLVLLLNGIRKQHPEARFVFLDDGRKKIERLKNEGHITFNHDDVICDNIQEYRKFLADNGYSYWEDNKPKDKTAWSDIKTAPFTVFVLQSKALYQASPDAKRLVINQIPQMIGVAETKQFAFVFSDVKPMAELDARTTFNNYISAAFLLDNIGDFILDRGNKSVFADLDAKEMKAQYAKCSIGDGFLYNIESDKLDKLKIIYLLGGKQ